MLLLAAACAGDPPREAAPAPSPDGTTSAATSAPAAPESSPPATPEAGATSTSAPASAPPRRAGRRCTVPAHLAGRDLERFPTTRRQVALTFDGGANADAAPRILRILAARGVPATFFLTGGFVQDFPEVAREIGRSHVVGNHTMNHPDFTGLSPRKVRREISLAEDAITETTGQDPRRYFRFPYGERDARALRLVNGRCYVAFRWTVDTLGWKGTSGGQSAASVVDLALDAAAPGAIVLMHLGSHPHDGSMLDADALPTLIRRLRGAGYELVALSAALPARP